jgi:hypothetical protein
MTWTQRINVTAQQRNAGSLNTSNFRIPAIVDELRADFEWPNQLTQTVSSLLRVQFSLDNGITWQPNNVFAWELDDKIGTIDKNGNTVTENPIMSFIIPVPESAKSALMRARITLNTPQFIGLTVYTQ